MHDPGGSGVAVGVVGGHVRGEVGQQRVGVGQRTAAGAFELASPPPHLALEEAGGSTEVAQADVGRHHSVQPGQHVDHGAGQLSGGGRAELGELRCRAVRRADHPLHHVELRADHGVVGAVGVGRRHRHVGAGERRHRGVLTAHVVGGGLHVAERRAAHDPRCRAVGDLVGEVGLPARDQGAGEIVGDLAGAHAVVPAPVGVEVETLQDHGCPRASTLDCRRRIPASQRSGSAARAA